jgi:hypothetical protein
MPSSIAYCVYLQTPAIPTTLIPCYLSSYRLLEIDVYSGNEDGWETYTDEKIPYVSLMGSGAARL